MKVTPHTTVGQLLLELQRLGVRRFALSFPVGGAAAELFPGVMSLSKVNALALHQNGDRGVATASGADAYDAIDELIANVEKDIAVSISKETV